MKDRMNVGIIGCGNIARGAYVPGVRKHAFLELVACADVQPTAAQSLARDLSIPRAVSTKEILQDRSIDIILNLTTPQSHAPINLACLEAGKHVYVEKPFALNMREADGVIRAAKKRGLRVSAAPDTFLGSGIQTSRKALDEGAIGSPTAAMLCMACGGHESWHPAPEFYYKKGGGPLLDMGPYYLTAAVNLFGPVNRVSGLSKKTWEKRIITSKPLNGRMIEVEVETHIAAVLEFSNGVIASMVMSFDVQAHRLPCIEVYGTKGSLAVPDPNGFGGPVLLWDSADRQAGWKEIPLITDAGDRSRGIGAADMAKAVMEDRPHRASAEMAAHVLEVMLAVLEAGRTRKSVAIRSTCGRPAVLTGPLHP